MDKLVLASLLVFLCGAWTTHAQVSDSDNSCRNGLFTKDAVEFSLGKIVGPKGSRVHFYIDTEADCPGAGARCRDKSYLIPGDTVVFSRKRGQFVCGWFSPRKGYETTGWLPAEKVEVIPHQTSPALDSWIGNWSYGSQAISIKRGASRGSLAVKGQAIWHGVGDNVHTGDLEFEAMPKANILTLEENEDLCAATLRLIGDSLVVSDNLQCGGVNVTFNGIYKKRMTTGRKTTRP